MRHWDTEKSWSPSFRERVANRRHDDNYRQSIMGFLAGSPRKPKTPDSEGEGE